MGVTPDLNDPRYIQEVYNTLRGAGMSESQFGGGFEAAKLGAPAPAPTGQAGPTSPFSGPGGGPGGATYFDGPARDFQTGPNTFSTIYGGGAPPAPPIRPQLGMPQPSPSVPGYGYNTMPSTYAVSGPAAGAQPYGFRQGPLPTDIASMMRQLGFPDLGIGSALANSTALPRFNPAQAAQGLGGASIVSPQSLNQLGPSGLDFFMGIIEQMLGMPWGDYLYGAYQPFQGLGNGRRARTYGLGTGMPGR